MLVVLAVALPAEVHALGRWHASGAVRQRTLGVVFAGSERVRLAAVGGAVEATTHESALLPVFPGGRRVSAVAAGTAGVAAVQEVFGRDVHLDLSFAVNADTVRHRLRGTKGPAGTAGGLVADKVNRVAVGPLLPCVEAFREVVRDLFVHELWQAVLLALRVYSQQTPDVAHGDGFVKVSSCLPSYANIVDEVDHLVGQRVPILRMNIASETNYGQEAHDQERPQHVVQMKGPSGPLIYIHLDSLHWDCCSSAVNISLFLSVACRALSTSFSGDS
uniref:Putative cathepsin b-like cysteine protease form 1 n=1 Tax=Ixodes ricinus TaxID=34613 RepID=A0A6B0V6S8_IXORI